MNTTEMFRFETENFTITATIQRSEQPDTSWLNKGQMLSYYAERLVFFDTTVEVRKNGHVIGVDTLCESSCYAGHENEFFTGHRDTDPMQRNCSVMRAAKGENVMICHYFPSMIREAIADARRTLSDKAA